MFSSIVTWQDSSFDFMQLSAMEIASEMPCSGKGDSSIKYRNVRELGVSHLHFLNLKVFI